MKKSFKTLRIAVAAVLILILVVVLAVSLFANYALKIGIETAATRALDVGVSVGDVDLSILGGKIGLEKLAINNPPGYQYARLLELEKAKIEVAIKSLLGDVVNIRQISLDGVNVFIEQKGISGNNLRDVIGAIGAKSEKGTQPSGRKLHIDNLEISNVTVNAKLLPVPGKKDTVVLKLAPIRMTDLGSDNKLDTAALSAKILLAVAKGVAEQGAGVLPGELTGAMKSTLDKTIKLSETASEEGKKLIDTGKDVIKEGKDIGQEVTEGLKGLLKPKQNHQ
jgi:hypothetical protein